MTKRQFSFPLLGLLILGLGAFGYFNFRKSLTSPTGIDLSKPLAKITVEVVGVTEDLIPLEYTCEGEGISPGIKLTGMPKGAKSLAVVVDDKDSTLGTFTHWIVWDIDPFMQVINRDETPSEATVGKNSYGKFEWGPLCPSAGPAHHYRFKVYAYSDYLNFPADTTTPTDLTKATKDKLVGYGETVALFGK